MVQQTFATPAQAAPADERDLIVSVVSSVLTKMVSRAESQQVHGPLTRFDASKIPGISIQSYLDRIVNFAPCSPECFIIALVYIDRVVKMNPKFVITSYNIHRLLITSTMLAAKYLDDCYYNNSFYAKVGGVPPAEMNILELEFLRLADFNLGVSKKLYDQYRHELHRQHRHVVAQAESSPRTSTCLSPPSSGLSCASASSMCSSSPASSSSGLAVAGASAASQGVQHVLPHVVPTGLCGASPLSNRHLPLSPVSQQASPIPKFGHGWSAMTPHAHQSSHNAFLAAQTGAPYSFTGASTPVRGGHHQQHQQHQQHHQQHNQQQQYQQQYQHQSQLSQGSYAHPGQQPLSHIAQPHAHYTSTVHQQLQMQQQMAAMPPLVAAHTMLQLGGPSPSPSPFPAHAHAHSHSHSHSSMSLNGSFNGGYSNSNGSSLNSSLNGSFSYCASSNGSSNGSSLNGSFNGNQSFGSAHHVQPSVPSTPYGVSLNPAQTLPFSAHAHHVPSAQSAAFGTFCAPCECFSENEHRQRVEQCRNSIHGMCQKIVEAEIEANRLPWSVAMRASQLLATEESRSTSAFGLQCTHYQWMDILRLVFEILAMENAGFTASTYSRAYKGFSFNSTATLNHAVA